MREATRANLKAPTIKQALAAIKLTGAKARWVATTQEYRVNIPAPDGTEATAYYTNDATDAEMTAKHMMRLLGAR